MIRSVFLASAMGAALTQVGAAQTALGERPGLWISVPRAAPILEVPVLEAPSGGGVVLQAPEAGPLLTAEPAASVALNRPETALRARPAPRPGTRPVPRPRELERTVEAASEALPEPQGDDDRAGALAAIAPDGVFGGGGTAGVEMTPERNPDAGVADEAPRPVEIAEGAFDDLAEADALATVALAEALAAQIAAEAHAIARTAPRAVPTVAEIAPFEALAPAVPVESVWAQAPLPPVEPVPVGEPVALVPSPPFGAPMVAVAFAFAGPTDGLLPMSAVLLPVQSLAAPPLSRPDPVGMPPLEQAPILPQLHPSGPFVLDTAPVIVPAPTAQTEPLAAVLVPSYAAPGGAAPRLMRAAVPAREMFPMSALPPSALPPGPDSLTRAIQPPHPFAEANAAVLMGRASAPPTAMAALSLPAPPAREPAFSNPDIPAALPAPDSIAVARMVDDAMICWRLADLGAEARWARVSVGVALDETNMPAAPSIRLTGFAGVVSGAAEQAYRAAHAALMGCAGATGGVAATTSTTLIFDRSGIRLQ